MTKDSFILYNAYEEQFSLLSDEDAGVLIRAIFAYNKGKDLPEMNAIVSMAFSFIRCQMDRDHERYAENCRKNAENGAKGGRPKKANGYSENQSVSEKPNGFFENPNDNDYEDDNEDDFKRESVGKRKPARPERHKYGMYKNVLLSDEDIDKLQAEIPNYLGYIEEVSEYVAKTGKGYKDYLAAIRSWHRKDQAEGKTRAAPVSNRFNNFPQRDDYDYESLGKLLNFKPV